MNIKKLLTGTEFDSQAEAIAATLENFGIDTPYKVENAPSIVGTNICGCSIHEIASVLAKQLANSARADENELKPKKQRRSKL